MIMAQKRAAGTGGTTEDITDIVDGSVYKKVVKEGDVADIHLTFTLNTDGVSIFSSSKKGSLWPVYLAINELPIKLRFTRRYLLPCYLHWEREKPNMSTYLYPLMKILKTLHNEGVAVQTSMGELLVKAHLITVSVDLPARAMVSNMKQFNGKHACTICMDEGTSPPGAPMHRFYPYKANSEERSHESMISDAQEAAQQGEAIRGVKGAGALMMLEYVNLPTVFSIDWMHCVLLGVTKALMRMWFDNKNKNKEFHMGNKMALINKRLLSIKVPDFVSRIPRKIEDHSHWKASECREWLIHYSPVVLLGLLPPRVHVHYLLLVTAMATLTKEMITLEEINTSENQLKDFCRIFPNIYDEQKQTMNVHMLKHIGTFTRLYGPLFTTSCFGFESMNCYIKSMIHGSRYVNNQVSFAVGMPRHITNHLMKLPLHDEIVRKLAKRLAKKYIQFEGSGTEVPTEIGKSRNMSSSHEDFHRLPHNVKSDPKMFLRIQRPDGKLHSRQYNYTKTRNSYTVQFVEDGVTQYGSVCYYVKGQRCLYALVESYETEPYFTHLDVNDYQEYLGSQLCAHIVKIVRSEGKRFIPVNWLKTKCVFMKLSDTLTFISEPSNLLEHG